MQVHAKVHAKRFKEFGGLKAVHEVEAGIEVGTQILKEYLNKTGSLKGALKYYVGAAKHSHDGGPQGSLYEKPSSSGCQRSGGSGKDSGSCTEQIP